MKTLRNILNLPGAMLLVKHGALLFILYLSTLESIPAPMASIALFAARVYLGVMLLGVAFVLVSVIWFTYQRINMTDKVQRLIHIPLLQYVIHVVVLTMLMSPMDTISTYLYFLACFGLLISDQLIEAYLKQWGLHV